MAAPLFTPGPLGREEAEPVLLAKTAALVSCSVFCEEPLSGCVDHKLVPDVGLLLSGPSEQVPSGCCYRGRSSMGARGSVARVGVCHWMRCAIGCSVALDAV